MFVLEGTVIYSPTDLAVALECEFALLRRLDVKLGRAEKVHVADPLMERAALLGDTHEQRVLQQYRESLGPAVVEFPSTQDYSGVAALEATRDATLDALRSGAGMVFQGAFFDGRFHGRSDFLELRPDGYAVLDSKLARREKVAALLQLAGYADQLERFGVPLHARVGLILGDGRRPEFPVQELLAVYRHRRARMELLLDAHQLAPGPAEWARTQACGRCADCAVEVAGSRDVLLVAGMRVTQRARLLEAGIRTVEELAASTGAVPGIGAETVGRLQHQARLQSAQDARPPLADGRPDVHAEVIDPDALLRLPAPDAGDLFFDFEGDPLWDDGDGRGGLEYLFGVMEVDGTYRCWTAHSRAEEHAALRSFLEYVQERRARFPALRIYHYAAYERTALARLAGYAQHGEDVVDDLLRHGILVDLYSTVRTGLRVSQSSYSIKKLEPLYMPVGELRSDGDPAVVSGGDSVAEYARFCELREREPGEADKILRGIVDYNTDDCLSTLRLRDWLLGLVPRPAAPAAPVAEAAATAEKEADALPEELRARAEALGEDHPDAVPLRMLSAAVGYHQREDKPAWWEYFAWLRDPVEDWGGARDVFLVAEVLDATEWAAPTPRSNPCRTLRLLGTWGAGSVPGDPVVPLFAEPLPEGFALSDGDCRSDGPTCAVTCEVDADGRDVVTLTLRLRKKQQPYDAVPVALVPGGPLGTVALRAALHELGAAALGGAPRGPGAALLRRESAPVLPPAGPPQELVATVTSAVVLRAGSFVAVQGPPGTGKTYLGARVVQALVDRGWRVGVVAQSHAVVSNFLDEVVVAGVPKEKVGKVPKGTPGSWTALAADTQAQFLAQQGCVLGGTAWDFTNLKRVQRAQLDLLVVDEAGQFSLANTLAVSVSAHRLLLLGDPQQLPQVTQGTHPEPVDCSALSWLMEGAATIPPDRGYFLPQSWRMHPALSAKVSALAYEGRLESEPGVLARRHLEGVAPGLHVLRVDHQGNDVCSPEEAAEVVRHLRSVLGKGWREKAGAIPRPLVPTDLLVVAAYNAQVTELQRQLAAAGLAEVLVGTVDKLQGRQAVVVCVSLAASSAADVPRGMGFLLSRNRLTVAVSRGQWATVVVHSPALADHLPSNPTELLELGAFLALLAP